MIFTRPVRRIIAPPVGIIGKPTAPFQPNFAYANFPTLSALYFTNLISGQVAYVEDTIPARGNFVETNGAFGVFDNLEAYQVTVGSNAMGGENDTSTLITNESFATLIEFKSTYPGTWSYSFGHTTSTNLAFSVRNQNCADIGAYWTGARYCLPDMADGSIQRLCVRFTKGAAIQDVMSIALNGVMLFDNIADDGERQGEAMRVGRNQYGRSLVMTCSGLWEWGGAYDGVEVISDAQMLELTTDPWPHLAVLD